MNAENKIVLSIVEKILKHFFYIKLIKGHNKNF